MVCCTILAALLGLLLKPVLTSRSDPLAWRLAEDTRSPHCGVSKAVSRTQSFIYAFAGWHFLVRNEPNMRIHLAAALGVAISGILLDISAADWRWLIAAIATVLVAEALNTAVEQACNAVEISFNPAIKAAKDVAAGGVLIAALAAVLIGSSVFLPYLIQGRESGPQSWLFSICGEGR